MSKLSEGAMIIEGKFISRLNQQHRVLNYPKGHNYGLDDVKLEIMFTILVCETGTQGNPDRKLEDRKIIIPATLILGSLPDSSRSRCNQDILVPWLPGNQAQWASKAPKEEIKCSSQNLDLCFRWTENSSSMCAVWIVIFQT